MIYIKLNAGNDRNGNGRRGYLVVTPDGAYDFIPDDGRGCEVVTIEYPDARYTTEIDITPAEYRWRMKSYKVEVARLAAMKKRFTGDGKNETTKRRCSDGKTGI